jgi:hypothetical protein
LQAAYDAEELNFSSEAAWSSKFLPIFCNLINWLHRREIVNKSNI